MYLTIKQAAEKTGFCAKTISRRIHDGSLPCYRFGQKTIRIDEKDLQAYIEKHKFEQ